MSTVLETFAIVDKMTCSTIIRLFNYRDAIPLLRLVGGCDDDVMDRLFVPVLTPT